MSYPPLQLCFGKLAFPRTSDPQHVDEREQCIQLFVGLHRDWHPVVKRLDRASLDRAVAFTIFRKMENCIEENRADLGQVNLPSMTLKEVAV